MLYFLIPAWVLVQAGESLLKGDQAGRAVATVELTESLDPTLGVDLLRDLCCHLKPPAKALAVRDFLERARGFVA